MTTVNKNNTDNCSKYRYVDNKGNPQNQTCNGCKHDCQ